MVKTVKICVDIVTIKQHVIQLQENVLLVVRMVSMDYSVNTHVNFLLNARYIKPHICKALV